MTDPQNPLLGALEQMARRLAPEEEGPWVVIAVLPMNGTQRAVPLMGGNARYCMRGFPSLEEALAASSSYAPGRMGDGWVLNISTGEVHPFTRMPPHVHAPVP